MKNEKKHTNRLPSLLACLGLAAAAVSCENFFGGDDLKSIIQDEVQTATAESVTLTVRPDPAVPGGTTSLAATTQKVGVPFSLSVTTLAEYAFSGWTELGGNAAVSFSDASSASTTATISRTASGIVIQANFDRRPSFDTSTPFDNENNVFLSQPITFSFDEAVDPDSVDFTTVSVVSYPDGFPESAADISGQFLPPAPDSAANIQYTLAFSGSNQFGVNHRVKVTLSRNITDLAGNRMAADAIFRFKTGNDDDTTAPAVNSFNVSPLGTDSRSTNLLSGLTLSVVATDNNSVKRLIVKERDVASGTVVTVYDGPYLASLPYTLANGAEGEKQLSAQVFDPSGNASAEQFKTILLDRTAPILDSAAIADASGFTAAFTDGPVSGTLGTITETGSGVGKREYQYGGSAWTEFAGSSFSAAVDGAEGASVPLNVRVTDIAGNVSATVASNAVVIDKTAPTVVLSTDHGDTIVRDADTVTFTATFTEAHGIVETAGSEPRITIGSLVSDAAMAKSSNLVWTYAWNVPAGSDGAVAASVSARDLAGNANAAATGATGFTVDNTAPTASVGAPSSSLAGNTMSVTYTVSYGGASSVTLDAADVTLNATGSAAGTVAVSGTGTAARTVTVSGLSGDGTLGITLAAGTAIDAAGNAAAGAGPSATFTVDNTGPTVSVGAPSALSVKTGASVTYTLTYSGASSVSLAGSDVTVVTLSGDAAGTAAVSGTGATTRTVTVSGLSGNGTLAVTIAAGTAADAVGNPATGAGPSASFAVDNTAPTVGIGAPSAALAGSGASVTYTVTYGGADTVTLASGNVTLNKTGTANGTVAVGGTGTTTRTVTVSGLTGSGTLGITLAAGTAGDAAGNTAPGAGPSATFSVDTTAPTVSIGAPSATLAGSGGSVTYTVTYGGADAVTLAAGNVTVSTVSGDAAGTAAVSGTGTTTRTVTVGGLSGNGTLRISLASGTASDAAGNPAPAAGPSASFTVDTAAPTLSIGAPSASAANTGDSVTYTVTYSGASAVTLDAGDVTVETLSGDAAGTAAVSGTGTTTRTVTVSGLSGNGTAGIAIAAGTANDAAGNQALGAGPSTDFTVDNTPPTPSIGAPSVAYAVAGDSVTYTITYPGASSVTLVAGDVTVETLSGDAAGTAAVSGTGTATRTVTVSGLTGNGTLGITIDSGTAVDAVGNTALGAGPSAAFTVDNTPPSKVSGSYADGGDLTLEMDADASGFSAVEYLDIGSDDWGGAVHTAAPFGAVGTTVTATVGQTLADGEYFRYRVADGAGNRSAAYQALNSGGSISAAIRGGSAASPRIVAEAAPAAAEKSDVSAAAPRRASSAYRRAAAAFAESAAPAAAFHPAAVLPPEGAKAPASEAAPERAAPPAAVEAERAPSSRALPPAASPERVRPAVRQKRPASPLRAGAVPETIRDARKKAAETAAADSGLTADVPAAPTPNPEPRGSASALSEGSREAPRSPEPPKPEDRSSRFPAILPENGRKAAKRAREREDVF